MQIIEHPLQPMEEWRAGVSTRMKVSAVNGAAALCIFEQWCEPGTGAPTHTHSVEEVLTVLGGQAEIWMEDDREVIYAGQSVIVPAGNRHGFRNNGTLTLHLEAVLASPGFQARIDGQEGSTTRWLL